VASNEAARSYSPSAPASRREVRASADPRYRFLSPHQAAVLDAATQRLIPGPDDDPFGLGYPEAYEAHVVTYVDRLLSLLDASPANVHAGGLRKRVAGLRDQYTNGIAMLDQQAGGDFTVVPRLRQDLILSQSQVAPFASLLFGHIIETLYAAPEYAGRHVMPRQVNRCDDPPAESEWLRSPPPIRRPATAKPDSKSDTPDADIL
jgi:Gluconate 2-dehydrogenase subunit 3